MGFLDWSYSVRDKIIYLSLCLGIPSIVLYVAEIVTILRHEKFRQSSFYALFIIRAIADLLYVLDSYYCYRLTMMFGSALYPLYARLPNWMIGGVPFFFTAFTSQANRLATAFILLSRLTAITMPLRHEKLWRKWLPLVTVVVYGVPILSCWQAFKLKGTLLVDNNTSTTATADQQRFYLSEAEGGTITKYLVNLDAFFSMVFLVTCVLLNIGTFVAYKLHVKQQQLQQQRSSSNNNTTTNDGIERKLLIYAVATFVGHLLISCLMIGLVLNMDNINVAMALYAHYPWVMDFGTVVCASWLLIWASDSFRQQLFDDLKNLLPPMPNIFVQFGGAVNRWWRRRRVCGRKTAEVPLPPPSSTPAIGNQLVAIRHVDVMTMPRNSTISLQNMTMNRRDEIVAPGM